MYVGTGGDTVPSLFDTNCCIVEVLVFARDEIEVSLASSLLVTFLHPWEGGFQGPKVTPTQK